MSDKKEYDFPLKTIKSLDDCRRRAEAAKKILSETESERESYFKNKDSNNGSEKEKSK